METLLERTKINMTSCERKASTTLVSVVKYYNHYMVRITQHMLVEWRQDCRKQSSLKGFLQTAGASWSCCSSNLVGLQSANIERICKVQYLRLSLMLLCLARFFWQSGSIKLLFHQFMLCTTYRTNIIVKQGTWNITGYVKKKCTYHSGRNNHILLLRKISRCKNVLCWHNRTGWAKNYLSSLSLEQEHHLFYMSKENALIHGLLFPVTEVVAW
jgi:hypothetical protein